MSKKFSRMSDRYNDDDDGYENSGYREDSRNRRKQKVMKNALRTKNIDALMELDEDY